MVYTHTTVSDCELPFSDCDEFEVVDVWVYRFKVVNK